MNQKHIGNARVQLEESDGIRHINDCTVDIIEETGQVTINGKNGETITHISKCIIDCGHPNSPKLNTTPAGTQPPKL